MKEERVIRRGARRSYAFHKAVRRLLLVTLFARNKRSQLIALVAHHLQFHLISLLFVALNVIYVALLDPH